MSTFFFLLVIAVQSVTVLIALHTLYNLVPTFPHEGSFIMVHYLCRYQSVIDHPVVFHAVEAAVFGTAAELVLRQGTAQEGAHLLNGASQVLGRQNDTDKSPNQPKEWTSC